MQPGYWMNETSGILAPAVERYLNGKHVRSDTPILKAYLWQWINRGDWRGSGMLEAIKIKVATIENPEDIDSAVDAMVELGMDPF